MCQRSSSTATKTALFRSLPPAPAPPKMIKGARLHVVKGGPHCVTWTHAEDVNAELMSFLGEKAQAKKIVA
jgi:pimeloyl-ACP methyl ester carboxylesterase